MFFVLPQHPFVSQPLSRTLVIELLDKVSNPDQTSYQDHLDDDEADTEVGGGGQRTLNVCNIVRYLLVSHSKCSGEVG